MKRSALKRWIPFRLALIVATLNAAWPQRAQAADIWWDNVGGTANDWGSAANWSTVVGGGSTPAAIPGASDIAIFNASSLTAAQTISLGGGDRTVLGISMINNTNAVTIQGTGSANRTLNIGASGIAKTGSGALTIGNTTANTNANVRLTADQIWSNSNNTGAISVVNTVAPNAAANRELTLGGSSTAGNVVSGAMTDTGNGLLSLKKTDAGTWRLSGANTFAGQVTIDNGLLIVQSNAALGSTLGKTVINGTGSLNLGHTTANGLTITENIEVQGAGLGGVGAITNISAGGLTATGQQNALQGTVTMTGDTTFGGAFRWDIRNGILNGGGFNLTKVGGNSVFLSGAAKIGTALDKLTVREGEYVMETGALATSANITGGIFVQPVSAVTASFRSWGNSVDHTAAVTLNSTVASSVAKLRAENGATTHSGAITVTGGDNRLEVAAGQRMTLTGSVGGTGTLRKEDTGNLIWNASSTHGGAFNVNAGILGGGGTISSSAVNLAAGTTLSPANLGGSAGTLAITNGLVSNGANNAVFNIGTFSDSVAVGGSLTQNGTTTVTVIPGAGYAAGSYPLYTAASVTGAGTFILPANTHTDATIQTSGTAVNLVVNSAAVPTWTGQANGVWNIGSFTNPLTPNWAYAPQPGGLVEFAAGDSVLFDDTATGTTNVLLSATLSPASTRFNNSSLNYALEGVIGGTGPIIKDGTGTTTLLSSPATTGGIFINAGKLQFGNDSRSANAITPISVASGATLAIADGGTGITFDLAAPISGGGSIVLNATQQDTYHNFTADRGNVTLRDLTGFTGTITVNDGNRLAANTTNSLGSASGITIASGGALLASGGFNYGGPVSVGGSGWNETTGYLGAIRLNGNTTLSGPITLTSDTRITAYTASQGSLSGKITGGFGVEYGLRQIGGTGSGTLIVSNTSSDYTGDTSIIRTVVEASTIANSGVASSLGAGSALNLEVGTLRLTGSGAMTTDRAININQGGQGGAVIGLTTPGSSLTITGAITNGNAGFPQSTLNFINDSTTALGTGGTIILNTGAVSATGMTVHRQNLTLAGSTAVTLGYPATGTTAAPFAAPGGLVLGNSVSGVDAGPLTFTIQDSASLTSYGNIDIGNQNPGFVPGGTGITINQTGGTLNALRGGGSFNAGSDDTSNRAMRLGHWPNGNTTYNMSGGVLNAPNGYVQLAHDGNATFNQTAGTVNARGLRMGNANSVVGTLNLDGGTVNIGDLGIIRGNTTTTNLINLNGGTLRATANTSIGSGLPIDVKAGGAIIDTNGFNLSGASALRLAAASPGGGLTKNGAGLLELPAGNTYTGATVVNAGSLGGAAATFTASNVTVNSGASVSGGASFTTTTGVALTVNSGGAISPGAASGAGLGTITAATADLKAGSYVNITPGASGTRDFLSVTAANGLTTPTTGTVNLNVLPAGTLAAGTYDLIGYNTGISGGGFAGITANLPHLTGASVTDNGTGLIQLTHTGQETLTWTGTGSGAWDTATSNFNASVSGAVAYLQGDVTVFDSSTTPVNTSISIGAVGVTPASVLINDAAGVFSFSGSGGIGGGTSLTKDGAGTTILATNNTYTGTTTINAGTLQIGSGSGSGTLGAGSVTNNGTLTFNRTGNSSYAGVISGSGTVRHDGTGTTVLTAANTYSGGTTISKGTLEVWNAAGLGTGTITMNDASTGSADTALYFNPFGNDNAITVANNIVVAANGSGKVSLGANEASMRGQGTLFTGTLSLGRSVTLTGESDRTTFAGVISGAADTVTIAPSPLLDSNLRPGRVTWEQANTATIGTIDILDRAIFQAGFDASGRDQITDTATVNVRAGGTFQIASGDSETIGDLTGSGTVRNATNNASNITFGTANDAIFSGVINGGNALSFIKQGAGIATWSGVLDNPTGNITVNGGTMVFAKDSTPLVHAVGGNSTINSGGTIRLGGTFSYTRPESDGRAAANSMPTGAPANYVDQIYNNITLTINTGGTLDMGGKSEALNILAGDGTVTNSGTAASTLYVGSNNGDTTFNGTLQDGNGVLNLGKVGIGVMTLGGNNSYTGSTLIMSDQITITNLNALGSTVGGTIIGTSRDNNAGTDIPSLNINVTTVSDPSAPNILAEPITLRSELSNNQRSQVVNSAESTRLTGNIVVEGDNIVQISANQAAGDQFDIAGSITGTSNGILFLRGSGELRLSGVINAPNLMVAKTDAGLQVLNSTGHNYALTRLVHGTTRADVADALDTGAVLQMGQNGNGNTFDINGNSQQVAALQTTPGVTDANARTVTNSAATPADFTISSPSATGFNHNYSGNITGNLNLVKEGPGYQALSTPLSGTNSYTGDTIIRGGAIRLGGANLIPDGASAGNLIVGTGTADAAFDLNGNAETVNGLHGNSKGLVTSNGSGAATLTVGGTITPLTTATFAGVIDDNTDGGTGTLALVKSGAGTQILSGTNNYTGATTVNGGILQVDGSIAGSFTTVNNGGTLGGNGAAGGVSVNAGGTLSPGASPGMLTTGSVTTAAGSFTNIEIGGLTASSEYDRISTSGSLSLDGTLVVSFSFSGAQPGDMFDVWLNDGADPVTGTFAGLPEGASIPAGMGSLTITYLANADSGTVGNDVRLIYIPEPSAALLAGAAALLAAGRRRRVA